MSLPRETVKRLMKEYGAQLVSDEAADELIIVLQKNVKDITEKSIKAAHHALRKTIRADDIKLVCGLAD